MDATVCGDTWNSSMLYFMFLLLPQVLAESCFSIQMQASMAIRTNCTPTPPDRSQPCSTTCLATLQHIYSLPNQIKFQDLCMPTDEMILEYRARILQLQTEKRQECGVEMEFPLLPLPSRTSSLPITPSLVPTQAQKSSATTWDPSWFLLCIFSC
jgi:hypothetical protein